MWGSRYLNSFWDTFQVRGDKTNMSLRWRKQLSHVHLGLVLWDALSCQLDFFRITPFHVSFWRMFYSLLMLAWLACKVHFMEQLAISFSWWLIVEYLWSPIISLHLHYWFHGRYNGFVIPLLGWLVCWDDFHSSRYIMLPCLHW